MRIPFLLLVVIVDAILVIVGVVSFTVSAQGPPTDDVTPSITLDQVDPALGDSVTFTYTVSKHVKDPRIAVWCFQGDPAVLVFMATGPADDAIHLGGAGSDWLRNGGPAQCRADLYEWDFHPEQTYVEYASADFAAGG